MGRDPRLMQITSLDESRDSGGCGELACQLEPPHPCRNDEGERRAARDEDDNRKGKVASCVHGDHSSRNGAGYQLRVGSPRHA